MGEYDNSYGKRGSEKFEHRAIKRRKEKQWDQGSGMEGSVNLCRKSRCKRDVDCKSLLLALKGE